MENVNMVLNEQAFHKMARSPSFLSKLVEAKACSRARVLPLTISAQQ